MFHTGFRYHQGAIHLPESRLWLDAHDPIGPEESVFVSHAHSDHIAGHSRVIFSSPTQRLMRARVSGERQETALEWGKTYPGDLLGIPSLRLTLLPAGHILGSAMSLLEDDHGSFLYTGDFKLRRGLSAEPCEPRPADILVMETTYGRPEYTFPPNSEIIAGIIRFCRETLDQEEIPILLGYSLGKSQEILSGLAEAGMPVMLTDPVARLTRIYEDFGSRFPAHTAFDAKTAAGHVVLAPPGSKTQSLRRRLGACKVAVLTGWAVNPGCHFRYQADAAFPLSDHADFPDLVELVRQVNPRKVFTLHGFAAEFAAHLRNLGWEAFALGQHEQLELPRLGKVLIPAPAVPIPATTVSPPASSIAQSIFEAPPETFLRFAQTCEVIRGTRSKTEKCQLLAEYLKRVPLETLGSVVHWFTGRTVSPSSEKSLAVGWSLLKASICQVTGVSESLFQQAYLKHSDTGETAAEMWNGITPTEPPLSLQEIQELLEQLQRSKGPTEKAPLLVNALKHCGTQEVRFLIKVMTGNFRIGLKEGLVEEAVALAFGVDAEILRTAHQITGNLGTIAERARTGSLEAGHFTPFQPIRVMLASSEPDTKSILKRVQEWSLPSAMTHVIWLEDKYDGIRCQLHKVGPRVSLFSRELKDITPTFPELATAARDIPEDVVLDGEIVAVQDNRILPFAALQRRLGRQERDLFLADEIPIRFIAFDLLWQNGKQRIHSPLHERKTDLDILDLPSGFQRARTLQVSTPEEVEAAFHAARERGNEGLMIKDPHSAYTPGRRGLSWLKLKRALATLDCVVVGAEFGHGRRKALLSDYTFAVRDELHGDLKVIGKAYSGLTDVEIATLTERLLDQVVEQRGRFHRVVPEVVLEIAFDSIQPSARHNSGLALRFPRIVRLREDKSLSEIDTLSTARKLAGLSP